MSTALLELMEKVLTRHTRDSRDESIAVIPAIHDALDMDHNALNAIVQRYGGIYLRCDDELPLDQAPALAPVNVPLAQYLTELCASRGLHVVFSERDDRVLIDTEDGSEPTGSLPKILRVLSYLVSAVFSGQSLTVLSYPLSGLDEGRAALLWEATMAPSLFPPPGLRTFVPIAGGEVDVTRHCSRQEGAVRLVVRESEVIERWDAPLLADSLQMILRYADQPLMLFLGAGSSASCGLPQGNYLRDRALAAITNKPVGSADLVPEFRRWLTDHERWMTEEESLPLKVFERSITLERVLREEFFSLSGMPREQSVTVQRMQADCKRALDRQPEGRQALWKLATLLPRLVIGTVNFDQLVEDGMTADHTVIVRPNDFTAAKDSILARLRGEDAPLPILKLHGSIDDVGSLVVDIRDTSRGLPEEIADVLNAMIVEVGCMPWVWIGCSMRDADLGGWLAGKSGTTEIQEWWVDPLPPRSVSAYASEQRAWQWATLQQRLRDRQITETSDRFLGHLAERAAILRATA